MSQNCSERQYDEVLKRNPIPHIPSDERTYHRVTIYDVRNYNRRSMLQMTYCTHCNGTMVTKYSNTYCINCSRPSVAKVVRLPTDAEYKQAKKAEKAMTRKVGR